MNTYIAEVAGKDSVAAILKFGRENPGSEILPTVVFTSTEYGDKSIYRNSILFLQNELQKHDVVVHDEILLQNSELWNVLNARYQYLIYQKYCFFTPCIMCHLYTHLLRIPVYKKYGANGLITGERKSHSGIVKLNQHIKTIHLFQEMFCKLGIYLIQPLLEIEDTKVIDEIIANKNIITHANDVKCVLSGNTFGFSLVQKENLLLLEDYMKEFVSTVGEFCIQRINRNGEIPLTELDNWIRRQLNE